MLNHTNHSHFELKSSITKTLNQRACMHANPARYIWESPRYDTNPQSPVQVALCPG